MSQNRNSISKQVLAWTAVFALVLSILPYTVADSNSDEYFESWSYELSDTDGDNQDDTIFFTFDVDTNVTDYVDVEVNMNVMVPLTSILDFTKMSMDLGILKIISQNQTFHFTKLH